VDHTRCVLRCIHAVVCRRIHTRQTTVKEGVAFVGISSRKSALFPFLDSKMRRIRWMVLLTSTVDSSLYPTRNVNATAKSPKITLLFTHNHKATIPMANHTHNNSNNQVRRSPGRRQCIMAKRHHSTMRRQEVRNPIPQQAKWKCRSMAAVLRRRRASNRAVL
jgi:hypothetical protein